MRKNALVLLASMLLASQLLSQERPKGLESTPGMNGKPTPAVPSTPLGQRAFFSLAGELVPPGLHELKFELRIDGRLALEDVVQLPFDSAGGIVELLAGDPEGLARLFARAEKAGRQAAISIVLDGRTFETFTIPEFLDYNRRFQDVPPVVLKPLGETRTFGSDGEPGTPSGDPLSRPTKDWDLNCLANCDANRDDCYQTEPSCFGVDYCEVCENQWASCRNGCWICTDPMSVSEFTTSSIHSATWYGSNCLTDGFGAKYWYDSYALVIRNYRWRRTHYCNGSHTDTLLYTWDTSGSCLRNAFYSPCSFSMGYAYPPYCPF
jgi:hypothetical protein